MTASDRRIAIARISGPADRNGMYPITVGGDGLRSLKVPFEALLYRPDYDGQDLSKILEVSRSGPDERGKYLPVSVDKIKLIGSTKGRARLTGSLPEHVIGLWICVEISRLNRKKDEFYVYEILGLPISRSVDGEVIANVINYIENGAHGVIEVELLDKNMSDSLLVPMLSHVVDFTKDRKGLVIESLDDYILD